MLQTHNQQNQMIVGIQKQELPLKQIILAAEPQADVLPFQFQNERAVSHFHGAQKVHENQISSAFNCKLLVPDRKQSTAVPLVTSLHSCLDSTRKGQHHKPLLLPTPLPKSLH